MKKNILKPIASLLLLTLLFLQQGCIKDKLSVTYTYFEPVYQSKATVLQSVKAGPAQSLKQTGKLIKLGNYIFVNEINKGIHVIDNSVPSNPKNTSFINIPGSVDLAVRNNILYADIFTDLVAIDISDMNNIVLKKVIADIFHERLYDYSGNYDTSKYIVDYIERTTTDKKQADLFKVNNVQVFQGPTASSVSTTSVSGSMARFTIVNDYLYTVGRSYLTSFNISSPENPVKVKENGLGWNIETIYPLNDKLFIGSQTGMFIYSIANPAQPSYLSNFNHACFNDPVIADDHYAYVTLRARTETSRCWGAPALQRNELDIVNINNIMQPSLVKIYDMAEPQGMSKDGNTLFLCDGKGGLKLYDVSNVQDIKLKKTFTDVNPFDVIAQSGLAIVVAENGLYQYDYNDLNNVRLISRINISK